MDTVENKNSEVVTLPTIGDLINKVKLQNTAYIARHKTESLTPENRKFERQFILNSLYLIKSLQGTETEETTISSKDARKIQSLCWLLFAHRKINYGEMVGITTPETVSFINDFAKSLATDRPQQIELSDLKSFEKLFQRYICDMEKKELKNSILTEDLQEKFLIPFCKKVINQLLAAENKNITDRKKKFERQKKEYADENIKKWNEVKGSKETSSGSLLGEYDNMTPKQAKIKFNEFQQELQEEENALEEKKKKYETIWKNLNSSEKSWSFWPIKSSKKSHRQSLDTTSEAREVTLSKDDQFETTINKATEAAAVEAGGNSAQNSPSFP